MLAFVFCFLLFIYNQNCSPLYLNLSTSNYPPLVICDVGTKMSTQSNVVFSGLEIDFLMY